MRKIFFFLFSFCTISLILVEDLYGQGPRAQLVSLLADGCAGGANESLQEYMVVYTGPTSFVAGAATIDIKYGTAANPTIGITDSFAERAAIVAGMNANLPGGCDFSFSSVTPGVTTVSSNSHILIHKDNGVSGNNWPTNLDYSGWCGQNLGTVYVMWSTDGSWPSGGRFDDFPATSVFLESTINGVEVDFEYSAGWGFQAGGNYVVWPNGGGTPSTFANYPFCGASDETTLPVSLLSFNAHVENNNVKLQWVTVSEESNDFFEVQRSNDAEIWTDLGHVRGNGTTNDMNIYTFRDIAPPGGRSFYRLKQVDLGGTYDISEILSVDLDFDLVSLVFPNPASDRISLAKTDADITNVSLFNINGDEFLLKRLDETLFSYDVSQYQPGVYLLKYRENGRVIVQRLVIQ